jgi:hypothetical protein
MQKLRPITSLQNGRGLSKWGSAFRQSHAKEASYEFISDDFASFGVCLARRVGLAKLMVSLTYVDLLDKCLRYRADFKCGWTCSFL